MHTFEYAIMEVFPPGHNENQGVGEHFLDAFLHG